MPEQREMNIDEWCARLPNFHAVNRQLKILQHCRNHPLQWAAWDFLRRNVPIKQWKQPGQ